MSFRWSLPPSPTHKSYREIVAMIEAERERDPIRAMAWFAAVAETDFWFWQRHVMPLGSLKIQDKHHPRRGKLLVEEPWFFDRMREVQADMEARRSDVLYMWFRGSYKTFAVILGGSLWELARNPQETIAIFTHKVEQIGESMGGFFVQQLKKNETLLAHWPQFRRPSKLSDTLITIDRPEGPREPSISVHPILGSAASGHFTRIKVDDAVTERIARSPEDCKKVNEQLSYIQPLRRDDTIFTYVSTPYGESDPVYQRARKGKFFSRVSRQPAVLPGNVPQLFSLKYFKELERTMEEEIFQSQYMLRIIPKGGAYFRKEWLVRYRGTPEEAAKGCRIHIVIDMASGKGDDFTVLRVYGFTYEKKRRVLDLWREKIGMTDTADLLFGVMPGDEDLPDNAWKPAGGIVKRWQAIDPDLTVYVEEFGASGYKETLEREIRHRKKHDSKAVSCRIVALNSQRKKENRIAKLQPDYRNGVFEYPETGFGHGSQGDTERDTLEQFIEDEYKSWTLAGGTLNDDMLDTEAWTAQPEIFLPYPSAPSSVYDDSSMILESSFSARKSGAGSDPFGGASWRVF